MAFRAFLPAALLLTLGTPDQRIPQTHATTLTGSPIDLPQALTGHTTVLVLGFSEKSRDAVTLWGRRLAADYRDSSTILYYEMPVVADVPKILRGMVIRRIKQDVPPRAQPRLVPIQDHEDDWKAIAGFSKQASEDSAYLLLVDSDGKVRSHQAVDPPTDQSYAQIKRKLEEIKPL